MLRLHGNCLAKYWKTETVHELSVCQSTVSQVEEIAAKHSATGVSLIKLQIGPLSGIETTLLQQAFHIAKAGTIAEDARLEIEELPVRVQCKSCHTETDASTNRLVCSQCGDWQTTIISGDEMLLASIELIK